MPISQLPGRARMKDGGVMGSGKGRELPDWLVRKSWLWNSRWGWLLPVGCSKVSEG